MWSIHRGQKSKHITPTPKRPPLGTPPAAARQLNAQRSGFIVGECCRAQRIFNLNDCRWQSYLDSLIDRPRKADSLPNDKNQTSERFTSAQRREGYPGEGALGSG